MALQVSCPNDLPDFFNERGFLMILSNALPMASIGSMLKALAGSFKSWIQSGTTIIGYLILLVGIVCLLMGLHALYKQQPSGKFFLVAILAIAIGGYISQGFSTFGSFSKTEGGDSVKKALSGNGDTSAQKSGDFSN